MSESTVDPRVVDAVWTLFRSAGMPVRSPIDFDETNLYHPVFSLARHTRGHDDYKAGGYLAVRGDSLHIPCWEEGEGKIAVLEIGFHKGDTRVAMFDYVHAPDGVHKALFELLQSCETR